MAKVVEVRIEDHSDEVLHALDEQVEDWLEAVGEDAAGTAADFAPVGTPESTGIPGYIGGTLKNSISWATKDSHGSGKSKPKATPEEKTVYIGSNVEYAPYQEFGTSRGIKGKHFLQFGATAHQAEYKSLLEHYLKKE